MLRIMLLCLGVGVLGQVLPEGCPLTEPPTEQPPVERNTIATQASAPESASVGETVALTAGATTDLEGGTVSYSWLQILGPGVSILNADQAEAGFVAPSLPSDQTLGFLVTTTNERGDAGRAEVQVRVQEDPNYGSGSQSGSDDPVARAGADREVPGDSTVTLNGSTSQGTNLTYLWRQVGGGLVELQNADSAQATFVAPPYSPAGINRLEFELEVRDNRGRRSTDRIVITMVEPPDTDPTPRLLILTSLGSITVELDRENAPITVNNFLQYVADGFYNGTIFHRVVADFVIQGGGYEPGLVEKETSDPIENESDNGLDNGAEPSRWRAPTIRIRPRRSSTSIWWTIRRWTTRPVSPGTRSSGA